MYLRLNRNLISQYIEEKYDVHIVNDSSKSDIIAAYMRSHFEEGTKSINMS